MIMEEAASFEELGSKKLKLWEGEDRISALPDSIVHHILSLLESTKEAIQTCVLSKRWKNQWTDAPVLIFDLFDKSFEYSSRFIDSTLGRYACSKIQKFRIRIDNYDDDMSAYFNEKINFAIGKRVDDFILEFAQCESEFSLPETLFNYASLVRLKTYNCSFEPEGKVNWKHLKALDLRSCAMSDSAVDNIFSGCPVLESLVIVNCVEFDELVIVSQYLKNLELGIHNVFVLEISCPNLEKFCLYGCLGYGPTEFLNLSSLNQAILDFEYDFEPFDENLPKKILQQLRHAKNLAIGDALLQILSSLEALGGPSPPLLNTKCLIFYSPEVVENPAGIAYALRCSHMLEKLVINKEEFLIADDSDSENLEGNYWSSNKTVFNCLVSHLKIVSIVKFSKRDADYKHVMNLIEFLLKNAEVLEKLVVVFEKADAGFIFEVALTLLSFPRCSKHAVVEFLQFK